MFSERAEGKLLRVLEEEVYPGEQKTDHPALMYIRNLRMCRFETALEIGERLHVPPRALARGDIGHVQGAQVADGAREEALGGAH